MLPGLFALTTACGGGRPEPPPSLPALAAVTSVLRLPVEGGTALVYHTDSLRPIAWRAGSGLPAVARPVGHDPDQRGVYLLDSRGGLVTLDLETGASRTVLPRVRMVAVGPDGAAYAIAEDGALLRIARGTPTRFPAVTGEITALFGTLNGQVVAVTRGATPALHLLSTDRAGALIPIPPGPVAATHWGELIAVATAGEIRLIRPAEPGHVTRARGPDRVRELGFSPSGHRLYVLGEDPGVHVVDRFTGEPAADIVLPGEGRELRIDPSGRWLLVRPVAGDSVWVVDLATGRLGGTLPTGWRGDLPLVAGASQLLSLDGDDVVAWDLTRVPPQATARASRGGRDLWMTLPWVPPPLVQEARAAADSASARQDTALGLPSEPADQAARLFLQVSSSQNQEWADDLAGQLRDEGFVAEVWTPLGLDEGFRVVVGPYQTREEAEEAGRRLGRPFFVLTRRSGPGQ